jgi:alkylation response protein AidB-like acyl-CoA dehydrogenase
VLVREAYADALPHLATVDEMPAYVAPAVPPTMASRADEPIEAVLDAQSFADVYGAAFQMRAGMAADAFLVTASTPAGPGVFLVAADAAGVERQAQRTSDGDVTALVTFTGAAATPVGDDSTAHRLGELLIVAAAAEQLGVTDGALRLTAEYAKTREQFERLRRLFRNVGAKRFEVAFGSATEQALTIGRNFAAAG